MPFVPSTLAPGTALLLADLILVAHFVVVAFVVGGLALIWLGALCGWSWVRGFAFRLAHLSIMGIVAAQALAGEICPFTIWENDLRVQAGEGTYRGSFIEHWIGPILFPNQDGSLPFVVFQVAYLLFFAAVVASLVVVPPRDPWSRPPGGAVPEPVEPAPESLPEPS